MYKKIIGLGLGIALVSSLTLGGNSASAVSSSNSGTYNGVKLKSDIWLSNGGTRTFDYKSSSFAYYGTPSWIQNKFTVSVNGIGTSISGVSVGGGTSSGSTTIKNTGATFAGTSGTLQTSNAFWSHINGSSTTTAYVKGNVRTVGASTTKVL
ncbi:hypothetical protein BEH_26395 (plasmid) [Priestia filamentosa]|uniref:Uncharacterized protein n=1 Tax=Priestia filamentosa TaxID=1402861 RepID=A0A2S1LZS6_9BACI|nr:hypothetical protein [Priestia filamentosa]AWG44318.1 hypothetical protein BEH_26395 [Priestia filamentosa]